MVAPVSAEQPLIQQILLKPAENTLLDDQGRLSPEYIRNLQDSLQSGHEKTTPASTEVFNFNANIRLSYIRPMSGGVHVLGIEPGLNRAEVIILTEQLTADQSVEYAEPDFPRSRR